MFRYFVIALLIVNLVFNLLLSLEYRKRFDNLEQIKQTSMVVKCGTKCPLCGRKLYIEEEYTMVKE